jgi:hypothetical protein
MRARLREPRRMATCTSSRPSFEARARARAPTGERNCVHPGDDGHCLYPSEASPPSTNLCRDGCCDLCLLERPTPPCAICCITSTLPPVLRRGSTDPRSSSISRPSTPSRDAWRLFPKLRADCFAPCRLTPRFSCPLSFRAEMPSPPPSCVSCAISARRRCGIGSPGRSLETSEARRHPAAR